MGEASRDVKPQNLLFIISDQHNRNALGCYGHPCVQTPNLDRLAAGGTRFTRAYTNCPICVPARASLATGRYVHQIGNWDNAFPYDGSDRSWAHVLRDQRHRVDSIGKLHFDSVESDHGFTEEIQPLHVVGGTGDLLGSIREGAPFRNKRAEIEEAGPGDSSYLQYDVRIANAGIEWLQRRHESTDQQPWVCFLSFVCPHPPYIAPDELFALYLPKDVPLPPQWQVEEWPRHEVIDHLRRFFGMDVPFSEATLRRLVAAYLGMCTHLDRQIGRVLDALKALGFDENTRVVYTSDHGEHMGGRGLFGKFTMYEDAAAVPMILAGPDVPRGRVVTTPVSLVDVYPTILEGVGAVADEQRAPRPGRSLWQLATQPSRDRTILCEYHAVGSQDASFALADSQYKYMYHVNRAPQLFDLVRDPDESQDLAGRPEYEAILAAFEQRLRDRLDPEAVNEQAHAAQHAKVAAFGGRDAVIDRGAFHNSPVPGEKPQFKRFETD